MIRFIVFIVSSNYNKIGVVRYFQFDVRGGSSSEEQPLVENERTGESSGVKNNWSNTLVAICRTEQTKDKTIHELEKTIFELNVELKTLCVDMNTIRLKILPLSVFICVLSYIGFLLCFYFTKPADCTIGINSIQSRLNLLESELKLDNNIIPRVLWADDELKPNTTDLKPLSLPVIGVIAHHTGVIENRCFTIGELHNHYTDS